MQLRVYAKLHVASVLISVTLAPKCSGQLKGFIVLFAGLFVRVLASLVIDLRSLYTLKGERSTGSLNTLLCSPPSRLNH